MKNLLAFFEEIKGDALSQSEIDALKKAFNEDIEKKHLQKKEKENREINIYDLTKRVILDDKVKYPALAAYQAFLKYNATYWLKPDKCNFRYTQFGLIVIPEFFNPEIHDKLNVTYFEVEPSGLFKRLRENEILPHQLYLHEIVEDIWAAEKAGFNICIKVECVRRYPEVVLINYPVVAEEKKLPF